MRPRLTEDILAYATDPAAQPQRLAGMQACRDTALSHWFDPTQFGASITVSDYEEVREALGIAQWNVIGNSYDTTVAMTFAALNAGTIRTLPRQGGFRARSHRSDHRIGAGSTPSRA